MKRLWTLTFVLLISLAPAALAGSPRQTVETIIEKARTLDDKATHKQSAQAIENLVDFGKLTTDALGRRSGDLSAAQKAQIQDLLRKLITKTVYPKAPTFFRDVNVQYTAEKTEGQTVRIASIVNKGRKRSTVEYWLAENAGTYRVVDFSIEGERWVENVRDQFDEVIGKHGAAGLISKMKKRIEKLDASSKSGSKS